MLDSPGVDNDVPAIREFVRSTAPDAEVLIPEGLDDVRAAVASASVVVASRMHACLNALSVGTAAIPLAYSRKFDPLLRDLGWNHTVDLRSNEDAVTAVLRELDGPRLHSEVAGVLDQAHRALARAEHALRELP